MESEEEEEIKVKVKKKKGGKKGKKTIVKPINRFKKAKPVKILNYHLLEPILTFIFSLTFVRVKLKKRWKSMKNLILRIKLNGGKRIQLHTRK